MSSKAESADGFKRDIGPKTLSLYGIGTVVGAGIYVVIGDILGRADALAPFAFLLAAFAASLSALSYAELAVRVPESGGSAAFVDAGFSRKSLTVVVGYAVVATGVISAATIATGFVGYANVFLDISKWWAIPLLVGILTGIAATGIRQAGWFMAITTVLGIAGLVWVVGHAGSDMLDYPQMALAQFEAGSGPVMASAVLPAAFLAFYAYIGFEDLVTLSEEAEEQASAMPRAIVTTLIVSLLLYVVVSIAAITVIPAEELAQSAAPLVDVVRSEGSSGQLLGVVSLAMIVNGALAQIVMAPRVLHDLHEHHGAVPHWLVRLGHRSATPVNATLLCGTLVLVLALFFPTVTLASWTSFVVLGVFAAANGALVALKLKSNARRAGFEVPLVVPILGIVVSLGLIAGEAVI
ncbi:APC family permease [Qipengyuania sp.]|uniref:APC family permease n=1 Tax=Qipengyuania sp. TaxID=2004515 RepID=UPI003BAC0170